MHICICAYVYICIYVDLLLVALIIKVGLCHPKVLPRSHVRFPKAVQRLLRSKLGLPRKACKKLSQKDRRGFWTTNPGYRPKKPRKIKGTDQLRPTDLYLGFPLICLICARVLHIGVIKPSQRIAKAFEPQIQVTGQWNLGKSRVESTSGLVACTLDFPWFLWPVPWFCI